MLYIRRDRFAGLSKKVGKSLSRIPMSANQWTILSLALSLVTFFMLATRSFLLAAVLFAFTAFIDMVDGAVAREKKSVTKIGGYLDSMTDRSIEFLVILGLMMAGFPDLIMPSEIWLSILLFGSFMSTYARAAAFEKKVFADLKGGILEHTDRLVFFILIFVLSSFSMEYASYAISAMTVLAVISAIQRFSKAVKG